MEQADNPGLWPEPNTVEVRLRRIHTGLSVGICQAYDLLTICIVPDFYRPVKNAAADSCIYDCSLSLIIFSISEYFPTI